MRVILVWATLGGFACIPPPGTLLPYNGPWEMELETARSEVIRLAAPSGRYEIVPAGAGIHCPPMF